MTHKRLWRIVKINILLGGRDAQPKDKGDQVRE